jgi:ParB/RepB/Spo0J family partition protein
MSAGVVELEIDKLFIGECNVRQEVGDLSELKESVERDGVLQPLIVRPVGDRYEVVVGSRRYRAALEAGLRKLPCIVRELSDEEAIILSLVENVQRSDLSPREVAEAYLKLKSLNPSRWTQTEFARAIKKSIQWVNNMLLAFQSLERFKGVVEDVKPRPTEEERKAGIAPVEYLVELERAVRAVEKAGGLPKEALDEKARELAEATKTLPLDEALKVFDMFRLYPEKPIAELMALAGVGVAPATVQPAPTRPSIEEAAAPEMPAEEVGEMREGELRRSPYLAPRGGETEEEFAGAEEEQTPEEKEMSAEEVSVEYVVGIVRCPKCGVKLELIHREPSGHKVREVGDA